MNQHMNRLSKLEKETTEDDPAIIQVLYVRDWRADNPQDVVKTRYILPGVGWITEAEADALEAQRPAWRPGDGLRFIVDSRKGHEPQATD